MFENYLPHFILLWNTVFHYFDYVRVTKSQDVYIYFPFFRDLFSFLDFGKKLKILGKIEPLYNVQFKYLIVLGESGGTVNEILMKSIMHFKLDSFVKKSEIASFDLSPPPHIYFPYPIFFIPFKHELYVILKIEKCSGTCSFILFCLFLCFRYHFFSISLLNRSQFRLCVELSGRAKFEGGSIN